MGRSHLRVTAALQPLSLSHYTIIMADTSLWVVYFFPLEVVALPMFYLAFFSEVVGKSIFRNPFSFEHFSQHVYYS